MPLHCAAFGGRIEVVEYLLAARAMVHDASESGCELSMYGGMSCCIGSMVQQSNSRTRQLQALQVETLVQVQDCPSFRSNFGAARGQTALQLAQIKGSKEVIAVLKSRAPRQHIISYHISIPRISLVADGIYRELLADFEGHTASFCIVDCSRRESGAYFCYVFCFSIFLFG